MKKLFFSILLLVLSATSICSYGQELTAVKRNGRWGFVDKTGNVVIPYEYKEAREFSEELVAVKLKNRWGFIDKTGKVVIPFEYYNAKGFSEGLAAVKCGSKWGYIDKTGNMVIYCKYWKAIDFKEGLAAVNNGNKCGFIDKTGKIVIPFDYKNVSDFSEGLAAVQRGNKCGFIDKTGKVVIPLVYNYIRNFSEGLAAVQRGNKCGFIDKTGKVVIPLEYFEAWDFSEGLALVQRKGKWGYIDKTGKVVVPIIHLSKYDADEAVKKIKAEYAAREREERERVEQERIANLFSTFAKTYVEPRINEWEQKGEFETTAEWQQRVDETSRRVQIARLTQEAEVIYIAEQVKKLPAISLSLGRYDANRELFLINNNLDRDIIILYMPLDKAINFRDSWTQITRMAQYAIENDQMTFAGIDFRLPNGETYKYRISKYEATQANYNFVSVEIKEEKPVVAVESSARTESDYDVITFKNGDEIKAKVIEITQSEIKYKRFDYLDGPGRVALKTDVFAINYSNGTRELFNTFTDNTTTAGKTVEKPVRAGEVAIGLSPVIYTEQALSMFGFCGKLRVGVANPIRLEGSFTYNLPKKISIMGAEIEYNMWNASLNMQAIITKGNKFLLYPFAGLSFSGIKIGENVTFFGLNSGIGFDVKLSNKLFFNLEPKYILSFMNGGGVGHGFSASAGLIIKF